PGYEEEAEEAAAVEDIPDYTGEEEAVEEEEAPGLTYGNLNRENVLPLAMENIGRTVDLLRSWIEQRSAGGGDGGKPS
ncbi:MAG: hypothetical protein LBV70_06895, partial [Candidatus Adiutrix sp.]|nr:hypothetical protein [Candidatus Adiutrix sp.]